MNTREIIDNKIPPITQPCNIIFIGNSITFHGKCSYWHSEWGMAASENTKDYVHLVVNQLAEKYEVSFEVSDLSIWEMLVHDRAQFLKLLQNNMSRDLSVVIVQGGEGITDTTTLAEDFEELINYIKTNAPNAKVFVLGCFWEKYDVDNIKKFVAKKLNIKFISLEHLREPKYMAGMGSVVMGDDDKEYVIDHNGVAMHPGDLGMEEIAKLILRELL